MSYGAKMRALGALGVTPLSPLRLIVTNRRLIQRLTVQEIQARYKGAVLGLAWSIVTPLLALLVYTFVFTTVLPSRWPGASGGADFSLLLFIGLIIFAIFADTVIRAPGLLLENVAYLKKVVFPVEILPVVSVLAACANALLAFAIFILFHLFFRGLPPWQIVFLPLVIAPYALMLMGIGWFLSATGIYLRDLRYVIAPFVNLLMFLSPVFFPASALPAGFQTYLFLNPITFAIEASRRVALEGGLPDFGALAIYCGAAWFVAWIGLVWFMATRRGFADVV